MSVRVAVVALTTDVPTAKLLALPGGILPGAEVRADNPAGAISGAVADALEGLGAVLAGGPAVLTASDGVDPRHGAPCLDLVAAVRVGPSLDALHTSELSALRRADREVALSALTLLRGRLLVEKEVTYALLGDETTDVAATALLAACGLPRARAAMRLDTGECYRLVAQSVPGRPGSAPVRRYVRWDR